VDNSEPRVLRHATWVIFLSGIVNERCDAVLDPLRQLMPAALRHHGRPITEASFGYVIV
jgi:hypothetical protein